MPTAARGHGTPSFLQLYLVRYCDHCRRTIILNLDPPVDLFSMDRRFFWRVNSEVHTARADLRHSNRDAPANNKRLSLFS
jgi:hypothetical protein